MALVEDPAGESGSPDLWVPHELCDYILDLFAPPPLNQPYVADESEEERIRVLCTCVLVCRDWVARARLHLYHTIWVSNGPALLELCKTLFSCEHIIPLITRIVAARAPATPLGMPAQGYFPFHALFARRPKIVSMVFTNFWWDESEYPRSYRARIVPQNMPIVRLQLTSVVFPSLRGLFQLIRRFSLLEHLSIITALFEEEPSELSLIHMHELRPCWAASSLRTLEVGAPGPGSGAIPGVDLLGHQIEHFRAVLAVNEVPTPSLSHYPECVSKYASLRSLRITLRSAVSMKDPLPGDPDEAPRVWGPIHDTLRDFIDAVHSPLESLKIAILSQQRDQDTGLPDVEGEDAEDSPPQLPSHYRTTRSCLMDILFAPDIRDLLLSPTFAHLTVLQVVVRDNSLQHDRLWWTARLQQRIPGLPAGVIQAGVEYVTGSEYDKLWVPEDTRST